MTEFAHPSSTSQNREAIQEGANPLGMEGIEFIEYATAKPQQLGHILETMGFRTLHGTARAKCCCIAKAISTSSSMHMKS